MPPDSSPPPSPRGAFPTTHWSVVLRAGAGSESQARAALETLCRQYWYPLYAFVRREGRTHHEAEDCTQEFLSRLLATDSVARARPERGRFRTFLLAALRNFLVNEWERNSAAKRGGGTAPLSLQFESAEKRFALDCPYLKTLSRPRTLRLKSIEATGVLSRHTSVLPLL